MVDKHVRYTNLFFYENDFCDVLHSDIELVLNLYSKVLVQGFNKNISLPPDLGANVVLILF